MTLYDKINTFSKACYEAWGVLDASTPSVSSTSPSASESTDQFSFDYESREAPTKREGVLWAVQSPLIQTTFNAYRIVERVDFEYYHLLNKGAYDLAPFLSGRQRMIEVVGNSPLFTFLDIEPVVIAEDPVRVTCVINTEEA